MYKGGQKCTVFCFTIAHFFSLPFFFLIQIKITSRVWTYKVPLNTLLIVEIPVNNFTRRSCLKARESHHLTIYARLADEGHAALKVVMGSSPGQVSWWQVACSGETSSTGKSQTSAGYKTFPCADGFTQDRGSLVGTDMPPTHSLIHQPIFPQYLSSSHSRSFGPIKQSLFLILPSYSYNIEWRVKYQASKSNWN